MDMISKSKEELIQELEKLQKQNVAVEKELEESRKQLEMFGLTQYTIDHSQDNIYWIGPNGTFLFVNESACKNLGYTKEEFLAMKVTDLDPHTSMEEVIEVWENVKKHKTFTFETIHKAKDGKIIPVEVTSSYVEYGGKVYNSVFSRDISERKKAEEELKKTVSKHNKIVNNLGDVVAVIDETGVLIYQSPNVEKLLGWKPEELLNKSVFDKVYVDDLSLTKEKFRNIFVKDNLIEIGELRFKCKDGSYKWIKYTGVNLLNDPEIKGVLINYHDITLRKAMQKSLKESEARFKALHDASFGGIAIHDKGFILDCNQGLADITGYSLGELIGINGLNLIAERARKMVLDNILSGNEKPYEAVGLRKNGEEYPIRLSGRNIPYKGKMVRSVEFRDITEQKNTEKELRESEARFKALHNASFGGIAIHDNGKILECNQGLSEITGYSLKELYSMGNSQLISEKSRKKVLEKILTQDEKPYEVIGLRKNGEEYPLRLEGRNIPYKGKMVRCVEFKDITEQKNAEKALKESEQKFKDLANLLPQSIFETDSDLNMIFFNEQAIKEYRFSKDEIYNKINVMDTIIPEDRERAKQNITKIINNENKNNNEYTALRKDGTTFPVIIYSNLIIKDNKPAGLRGICFNITDIKKAEEELQKQNAILESQYEEYMQLNEVLRQTNYDLEIAREKAEESSKAKSIFLANMSHELRTPLFGMLGYSEMLMKLLEEEELKEMAAGINRTGKRLLNTLSLILDLSRMESDNFEVNTGEQEIISLLKEIYDNLKGGALAKNLNYSFLPHTEKLIVSTDPEMFRIIFENIIGNAIKFTSEGSITILTEVLKDKDMDLLSVKVADTGIGIDEENIPQVFEHFKQLSEGTTKNFQGSGLGLSITKKLIELLNGSINITSEKGIGTSVVVNVPI